MIVRDHKARLDEHEQRPDDLTSKVNVANEGIALLVKNMKALIVSKGAEWNWHELTDEEIDDLHGS